MAAVRVVYYATKDGNIEELGIFPESDDPLTLVPAGTYYCSLATLREIAQGRLGFADLDGVASLRLAAQAGKLSGRGQIRNSLDTAVAIVEGRFSKTVRFPDPVVTVGIAEVADRIERRLLKSPVPDELLLATISMFLSQKKELIDPVCEELRRRKDVRSGSDLC
jgi:hypothetical protein